MFPARQLARLVGKALLQPDPAENRARFLPSAIPAQTRDEPRHHHVLLGREIRHQMMELKDEADLAIAKRRHRPRLQLVQVVGAIAHHSRRRSVESAENVQQRRLADTGFADDGDLLGRPHFEMHTFEHAHHAAGVGVMLDETVDVDQRRGRRGGGERLTHSG